LETVDVRSKAGAAKIAGTLVSVGGATLLTLYKGVALTHTTSSAQEHITHTSSSKGRWMLGSALLVVNCITFSLWMLLQEKLTKKYPAVISSTAFMAFFSSVQAGALALTTQRRLSVWLLRGTTQIATVLFAVSEIAHITTNLQRINKSFCYKTKDHQFFSFLSKLFDSTCLDINHDVNTTY
jgi:hypothetical protein